MGILFCIIEFLPRFTIDLYVNLLYNIIIKERRNDNGLREGNRKTCL